MVGSFKDELKKAAQNKFAIGGFNFDNLETLQAIIEAAEEESSPVIIMATESAIKSIGFDYVVAIGKVAQKNSKVPVVFHLDHGLSIDLVKKAIDNNFSSVMYDGSLKDDKTNIKETKELVDYANKNKVDFEAEIGHVGGKEDDLKSKSSKYTTVEQALNFAKETKVDALAIAVGSSHGLYKETPNLQIDLIRQIAEQIKIPLVLHGGSNIPDEKIKAAIKAGIVKVNFGTDLKIVGTRFLRKFLDENQEIYDPKKYTRLLINEIKKEVKKKLYLINSINKVTIF